MKSDEFRELKEMISSIAGNMVTKDDIRNMATKDDIKNMATKDDIRRIWDVMATKADLEELRYVTSRELQVAHDSLKQSIDLLTDRVTMLEYKVDGAHNLVLDKKEYINRLPKTEDRLFALETVCREHTGQIGDLISASI
ncbi:MAG: hypothetical protein QM697_00025 [Lachnospiraceae bacterium]